MQIYAGAVQVLWLFEAVVRELCLEVYKLLCEVWEPNRSHELPLNLTPFAKSQAVRLL